MNSTNWLHNIWNNDDDFINQLLLFNLYIYQIHKNEQKFERIMIKNQSNFAIMLTLFFVNVIIAPLKLQCSCATLRAIISVTFLTIFSFP